MQETPWVRSLYLYLMCLVSIVLVGVGAVGVVVGTVHVIAPDLGHRDTLDRVGIGLANVASDVVDIVDENQGSSNESFCRDVTDNQTDFDECVADSGTGADSMAAIQDGIGEVRSELRSQIRYSALDHVIQGLLLIGGGILLFRIHGRRTELFADGLIPKPARVEGPPPAPAPPITLTPVAPAPPPPSPPPPGPPPSAPPPPP